MKRIAAATTAFTLTSTACAFTQPSKPSFVLSSRPSEVVPRQMGLFDGMKEAFSAPASMSLDSERETPIDRWMGWNVKPEGDAQRVASGEFIFCFVSLICLVKTFQPSNQPLNSPIQSFPHFHFFF